VALLIDAPFTRPVYAKRPDAQGTGLVTFTEQDRDDQIQLIVDLRRGVDLLTARPEVDPARLAYIGHSYGAAMGGLLAGVERRIRAYVLACGDGGLVAHVTPSSLFRQVPPADQARWLAAMEPIEPIHFVGHAAPAALFFQAGRRDQFIPREEAVRWQQAGSTPKQVTWYDADHFLNTAAIRDEVAWLQSQIGIDSRRFVATVRNLQPDGSP
jgi:dienelactone hydrolase